MRPSERLNERIHKSEQTSMWAAETKLQKVDKAAVAVRQA